MVECQFCGNTVVVPEALRVTRPVPPPPMQPPVMPPVFVTTHTTPTIEVRRGAASWLVWLIVLLVVCPTIAGLAFALLSTGAIAAMIPIFGNADEFVTQVAVVDLATALPQPTATPGFATLALTFGGEGTGVGRFDDPRAIAVDGQDNVYVGEYTLGRVQKFDSAGEYLITWTPEGENPVLSMAADRQGSVYTVRQGWIAKHNAETGEALGKLTADGYIEAVAALPNGNLVAYQRGGTDELLFLDPQGQELGRVPQVVSAVDPENISFLSLTVDGLGNIYIVSMNHDAVFRYDTQGRFVDRFGGSGEGPGQMDVPRAIAVDSRGRIFVADFNGIQVFTADGAFLDVFDIPTGGISGMAFTDHDALYVTSNTNEVHKFQLSE
jgi:hypothetical protein